MEFWNADELLAEKPNARYYFILSGRSKGKTYSVLRRAIKDNLNDLGLFAYVRRYDEEIKSKNLQELFGPQNVKGLSNGKYEKIVYYRGFFYYEMKIKDPKTGKMTRQKDPNPCGMVLAINTWERDKGQDVGAAHGGFKHIIFDEAITGLSYLPDEFQKFKNVISSLVRSRTEQDTKIWFLANPLSKWCPYFPELGINKNMIAQPGKRYEIKYPDTDMTTIFEYIGGPAQSDDEKSKVFETFFAFPNSRSKSKSITEGFWELEDSCHLPSKVYNNSDLKKEVFMYFGEEWIRGQIMRYRENGTYFIVWSPSRAPKKGEYYFILNAVPDKYAIIGTRTGHPYAELINTLIRAGQIYYSDNTVADLYHGFIKEAAKIVR